MIGSNNNWMHAPHQKEITAFAKWYNENENEKEKKAPETAPKKQMENFAKQAKTPEAKKKKTKNNESRSWETKRVSSSVDANRWFVIANSSGVF